MAQVLDPLPPERSYRVLCCYVNATSKVQVARICNIPDWYFERVVFPGQRLVFESVSQGLLEIHTGMMASAILSDTIPCDRLMLQELGKEESSDWILGNKPLPKVPDGLERAKTPALTSID
ncbi:DUF1830 domain-containing protein [Roseofilum casamattae]|uniref:DUF1830 domain-containing protein n=1 Tax=Roseofilum casamattae BLCC-M143 TaxID=3022442 RepID=A0ABT7C1M3_9CYAN|nr:DUF1830 domain-containing protein [Roseofilum casamattae]MDJ1185355.1 DUF1830 domain-containing protein [Roseofilum casamattae BLCC-M143]